MDSGFQPQIILSSRDKTRRRAPIVSAAQPVCQVCNAQFSQYTCPHCNLHYCSLGCFRAPAHASCSDSFDRKTLVDDMHANKQAPSEEKDKMMELLKKFEEQQAQLDEGECEGEDEVEVDDDTRLLREKLAGVDLDSLSPDDLLAFLSPAQLATFESTLADPSKVNALVEAEFEPEAPWWEVPEPEADQIEDDEDSDGNEDELLTARPALVGQDELPPLRRVDDRLAVSAKLVYNIVAVLFAYAYTMRTFSLESFSSLPPTSTERHAVLNVLARLIPFIIEKSTDTFDDVGSAVDSVIAREPDAVNSDLIALLMADVAALLQPAPIATLSPEANPLLAHPLASTLHALSDIINLLTAPPDKPNKPSLIQRPAQSSPALSPRKMTAGAQKVKYYASFVVSAAEVKQLAQIADALRSEARKRLEEESVRQQGVDERREQLEREGGRNEAADAGEARGPRIVELE